MLVRFLKSIIRKQVTPTALIVKANISSGMYIRKANSVSFATTTDKLICEHQYTNGLVTKYAVYMVLIQKRYSERTISRLSIVVLRNSAFLHQTAFNTSKVSPCSPRFPEAKSYYPFRYKCIC